MINVDRIIAVVVVEMLLAQRNISASGCCFCGGCKRVELRTWNWIMCERLESTLSRLLVPDNDVIRQVMHSRVLAVQNSSAKCSASSQSKTNTPCKTQEYSTRIHVFSSNSTDTICITKYSHVEQFSEFKFLLVCFFTTLSSRVVSMLDSDQTQKGLGSNRGRDAGG